MNVIEGIYIYSNQPSGCVMGKDKRYAKTKNQAEQYYRCLCKRLSEDNIEFFDKFILYRDKENERKNIKCFDAGFRSDFAVESLK